MSDFKFKEVADVVFVDLNTGKEIFYLDTLSFDNSDNGVYASGGNGSRTIGTPCKSVEVKCTNIDTQKVFYRLMTREQLHELIQDEGIVDAVVSGKYIAEFDVSYEVMKHES